MDNALIIFQDMLDWSIEPNIVCYNAIIDGFCKQRNMDNALIIFQAMLDRSIEPDVVCYSTIIDGFL